MVAHRKRYDGEPIIHPVRLPSEAQGPCRSCRKWAVLGDGLCVSCWDGKQMPNHKALLRVERQDKVAEFYKEGKTVKEIADILGVHWRTVLRDPKGIR